MKSEILIVTIGMDGKRNIEVKLHSCDNIITTCHPLYFAGDIQPRICLCSC